MCHKLFVVVILLIAVVLGILGVSLPMNRLSAVMVITNFFDIMLPILAVGALLKYLLSCAKGNKGCCKPGCCDTSSACAPTVSACSMPKKNGGCDDEPKCCHHD